MMTITKNVMYVAIVSQLVKGLIPVDAVSFSNFVTITSYLHITNRKKRELIFTAYVEIILIGFSIWCVCTILPSN
jgi:hypothetical protein